MVDDKIHDQLYSTVLQLGDQLFDVIDGAEGRVDFVIVRLYLVSFYLHQHIQESNSQYHIPYPPAGFCKLRIQH